MIVISTIVGIGLFLAVLYYVLYVFIPAIKEKPSTSETTDKEPIGNLDNLISESNKVASKKSELTNKIKDTQVSLEQVKQKLEN